MKIIVLYLLALSLLTSCAAYKQLSPEPKLTSIEAGYIPLKKGDKNFLLDKDKKYYIEFPAAQVESFYLVLNISSKTLINSYLTDTFDDGEGRIIPIPDESSKPDALSVYSIDSKPEKYFWVIDLVKQDFELSMTYRYVPRWRFQFENRYAEFQQIYSNNTMNRMPYDSLGVSFHFEQFNFGQEISELQAKMAALQKLDDELKDIESIFPADIVSTTDEAYQNYLVIKTSVTDELIFQNNYLFALRFFKRENETRGNPGMFMESVAEFNKFFAHRQRLADNIFREARDVIARRLPEVVPYYEDEWSRKNNADRIESKIADLETLYPAAGLTIPANFTDLAGFEKLFNQKVDEVWTMKKQVNGIHESIQNYNEMPSNLFFAETLAKVSKLQYTVPVINETQFGKYQKYNCVRILIKELENLRLRLDNSVEQYRRADQLVPQINAFKEQKNYSAMLGLVKQNRDLDFLMNMYKGIDQLSLNEQTRRIRLALGLNNWPQTEQGLKKLHLDNNFLNLENIIPKKNLLIKNLEDSLFNAIDQTSKDRSNRFMAEKLSALKNVDKLYADSAFIPVYLMTFTSGNQSELKRRNQSLSSHMKQLKEVEFPSQAIKRLYGEFTQNPVDNGVLKARAIVVHGKHYKGDDAKIKNRVAECDPQTAKWITQATEYRKIYVLPTTNNQGGQNDFILRLNLQIPSDAQFPVFDVNVKLPREIAQSAASQQWYETITLNKSVIKNEGRFSITSPTAENDYECQITPLRMFKDKDNILEIRFKHPSFKVYEVSVMAQKPIIKKN